MLQMETRDPARLGEAMFREDMYDGLFLTLENQGF